MAVPPTSLMRCRRVGVALVGATAAGTPVVWRHDLPTELSGAELATVDDVVGSVTLLALSAVLIWIGAALVLAAIAAAPGWIGSAATRAAAAITPQLLRRAVAAAVGLTVVGGAAPAVALVPSGATTGAPGSYVAVPASARSAHSASATAVHVPPLDRPGAPVTVTVEPGDTLWSIAAGELDPAASDAEIAAEWPRWYEANHSLIGSDPDLIHPGQHLTGPV